MFAILDDVFAPESLVEEGGKKYGWRTGHYTADGKAILGSATSAGATFWLAAAYSLALSRPPTVTAEKRILYETRLRYIQETSRAYRTDERGGWNRYPNQFNAKEHSTYMSALALLALLETRAAHLPWEGSVDTRDALLYATAQWLMGQFVEGDQSGWRGAPGDTGPVSDGLTLQIYSELLRAEEEAGVKLPGGLLVAIDKHVNSLATRTIEYPITSKTFVRLYWTPERTIASGVDSMIFIWHAWGIETCVRWVRRLEKHGAPREAIVRARRALGHLVVDLGDDATKQMLSGIVFPLAETLYALSSTMQEPQQIMN
jgi:hypothetical protein